STSHTSVGVTHCVSRGGAPSVKGEVARASGFSFAPSIASVLPSNPVPTFPTYRSPAPGPRPTGSPSTRAPSTALVPFGRVHPPTRNSPRFFSFTLRQAFDRRPDSYRESASLTMSPSQPSRRARSNSARPSPAL